MATRSEQFHADAQRRGKTKKPIRKNRTKPGAATKNRSRAGRGAKRATYALEITEAGKRPSRRSTRKSSNRAKTDSSFNRAEGLRRGTPEVRFHTGKARAARVRGGSAQSG